MCCNIAEFCHVFTLLDHFHGCDLPVFHQSILIIVLTLYVEVILVFFFYDFGVFWLEEFSWFVATVMLSL